MTDDAGTSASPHITVSLSGGGHRASLFGLGALLYLVDAGKGPEITSVASISGGSLTNGYVGLHSDLTTTSSADFWRDVQPLAVATSTGGTVWAWKPTYLYLALIVGVLALASWLCFPLDGPVILLVWAAALLVVGWLALQRSRIAAGAFDATVFHGQRLGEMTGPVDHIITATDLQTNEQVYFSGRFVYSYRHGWGRPADVRVGWAAQASACLPGAFAPVSRPVTAHGFDHARPEAPARFLLVDGGVYDNMGTEWPIKVADRLRSAGAPTPAPRQPDEVIVVNGSAGMGVVARRSARWPLLGELTSVLADKDVLYDQTTSVRRRMLHLRFRSTRLGFRDGDQPPIDGIIAQIDRSPTSLARSFTSGTDDAAARARKVLESLPAEDWDAEATANRGVGTTLSRIDADRAARLLRHSYVLTMADAHVVLGYPLVTVPELTRFRALVER